MKKYTLLFLLLSTTSLFSQTTGLKDSISIQLLNRQYDKVIRLSKQVLEQDSTQAWAWISMGQANLALLRYKKALSIFQKAQKVDPENISVLHALGQTYAALGDYKKAATNYETILQTDSTQTYARVELARSYAKSDQHIKALNIYKGLLNQYPNNFAYNKELGLTYLKIDSLDQATWFMHNAININNRDIGLITRLATLYNKEGDYKLALNVVRLGRKQDSMSIPLMSLEGYCNYLLQSYSKAIKLFEQARGLGDNSLFTAKHLGIAYIYARKAPSAIPLLLKVFQADSSSNNSYYLGMAYSDMAQFGIPQYDSAYFYFSLTLNLMEPNPYTKASVYRYLGGSLASLGRYKEAMENYKLAYRFDPSDYVVLYSIGSLYDHSLKDKKTAIKYYQQFLDRAGYDPDEEKKVDKKYVSVTKVAYMRIVKLREELHFAGELEK
jgi:tetratricopeptide (TPR) repeat protein